MSAKNNLNKVEPTPKETAPAKSKAQIKRDIRCAKIYSFIEHFIETEGFSPAIRDICTGCNIQSTSTVHSYLKRLEAEGKITYSSGKRRAITLANPSYEADTTQPQKSTVVTDKVRTFTKQKPMTPTGMVSYPLIGTVTAGVPILADEQIERELSFSEDLFPARKPVFALKVKGDSMIDAAILDGDIVIVEKATTAPYESIIVALIGDEATVKRLSKIDGKPYLMPENDAYEPIPFHSEDSLILGKVIGVMRTAVGH